MLKNFFKVAFRNLFRHKSFSFINIAGLALGFTACILIALFVWDEKEYDHFIPEGNRVYRIYDQRADNAGTSYTPRTPPMFASTLQQQFPGIDKTVKLMDLQGKSLFEAEDKKIYEEGGFAADTSFFTVFPLEFLYGTIRNVFADPNSIVITQDLSEKYFGNNNPMGKQLLVDKEPFLVKGVLRNTNKNFHLHLTYIIPMAHAITSFQIPESRMQSWGWQQFYTYVKIKPGVDISHLQSGFQTIVKEQADPVLKKGGSTYIPFFQPLTDIHLYSADFKMDNAIKGNIVYVRALTIIVVFILLIACFNFVNLSTAKSLQRAKEVGVRKSIGASRKQLIVQFTGETILISLISILLSYIFSIIFLNSLNHFTDKHISFNIFFNPAFILILFLLAFLAGALAGFYPALVLSGFNPVKVLKGSAITNSTGSKTPWLRHSFVIIQFTLSALLIICSLIVFRQVSFLHNKSLGFNKEEIMFFPMRGKSMNTNYEAFKNELLKSSGISNVSIGYGFPGDIFASDDIIVNKDGEQKTYPATQLLVDNDYVKTLGLQIISGRDFSKDIITDKDKAFIINETAVKDLGYGTPEKAIGQPLSWKVWESLTPDSLKKGFIVGVVKDFHFKSLYDKLNTAVIQIYPPAYWKVAVKMKTADIANSVSYVKKVWNSYSPEYPIEYKFLDDNFQQMYVVEDKLKTLLSLFTAIAIFVACLGLFGLAAYSAERRTKEIGIRKVLGANVNGIIVLLSKNYISLILISLIIASPVAWYFMNLWLRDFAYRTAISWWVFGLAAGIAVIIAMFTVAFQAIRAAIANPVKSLRTE